MKDVKIVDANKEQRKINDGWSNIQTKLNITGKDKKMGNKISAFFLDQATQEELYQGDDIAQRVVDIVPEEMTREGFEVTVGDDSDLSKKISNDIVSMGAEDKFLTLFKWARLYGGSAIFMGLDDGLDPEQPVDFDSIRKIEYMVVLDRYELTACSPINGDVTSENFGNPDFYTLSVSYGSEAKIQKIHYSRLIICHGLELTRRMRQRNGYWGDSVLSRLHQPLANYNSSYDSVATIMQDFTVPVFEIENLDDLLCSGNDDLVIKRLNMLNASLSIVNAIVIKKGENYSRKTTSVAGIKDILEKMAERLLPATGMPHTILFGESPSGLGATGESEKTDWFDSIKNQQEAKYRPALEQFFKFYFSQKKGPLKGNIPEDWNLAFNSLWQMDDKKKAELRKIVAETDKLNIEAGVLDASEVTESRYGGKEYSMETTIDAEIREKLSGDRVEQELERIRQLEEENNQLKQNAKANNDV